MHVGNLRKWSKQFKVSPDPKMLRVGESTPHKQPAQGPEGAGLSTQSSRVDVPALQEQVQARGASPEEVTHSGSAV